MNKSILAAIITIVSLQALAALPAPDEERYFDKEYARELSGWLAALSAAAPASSNPCGRNVYSGYVNNNQLPAFNKRNSELINSLLSIPKTMNDAGK